VVAAAAPAAAESGFQGSYVGVVVDPNRTGDALPSLLTTINQSNWVFDEALRQYRSTRPTTTVTPTSPDSQAPRGNQFQGRVDFANSPLSLRGTVFVGESTTAVLPSLSYDVGVGKNTNIYAGVGYAVVDAPAVSTPIGNQSGVVVTTGLEAAAGKNLVIFGDAKLNLNDRTPDGSSKVRVQFGAGLRF
jgi:hypothetical protein